MRAESRRYNLGIWALALGYFACYAPYSGLIKIVTTAPASNPGRGVNGLELLPATVIATAGTMFALITLLGWWQYAGRRVVYGFKLPLPNRWMFLSGFATAIIITTTTLAYTFSGISILFALLLLRGGVLMMGPLVDKLFKRRVRWFSWAALALSLLALAVVLADVNNYHLTIIAGLNTAAYLTGYLLRLPCMTKLAKAGDETSARRYFVEEQLVAMPLLVAIPAGLALVGQGSALLDLRHGFTTFWSSPNIIPALMIGVCYAALCVFGTLIYLDRRENTFCIPLNRCSSLLSGLVASYALFYLYGAQPPSPAQLASAGLIMVALLCLSPLHHSRLYLHKPNWVRVRVGTRWRWLNITAPEQAQIRLTDGWPQAGVTMSDTRPGRIFLFVCSGNTCRSAMAEVLGKAETAARFKLPLASIGASGIDLLSAGVTAQPGRPMTAEAQAALRQLGLTVPEHTTRLLTLDMVQQAEVIYCMTQAQCEAVLERFPAAALKIKRLDPDSDIEDPIGAALDVFLRCAERIRELIRGRFDELGLPEQA